MKSILFLWMNQSAATTMVPLTVEQMVDLSSTVVRGTVTEVWTEPDPTTHTVWTYAQVEVEKVFKGSTQSEVLVLEQPGGIWGTTQTLVDSVARFSVGEEGYFFVENLDSGRLVPAGMYQGKYNVIFDPYSRQELAVRYAIDSRRDFDHRFIPLPPEKKRVSTNDFENIIEQFVNNGWDGQPIPGVSLEKLERINKKLP